jgi:hypothetical protein
MQIQKTIPEQPNAIHTIQSMNLNLTGRLVSFNIDRPSMPTLNPIVSFDDIIPLLTTAQKNGFVSTVRQALALALNVDISQIPTDIFA